jgi:hypothetical protein
MDFSDVCYINLCGASCAETQGKYSYMISVCCILFKLLKILDLMLFYEEAVLACFKLLFCCTGVSHSDDHEGYYFLGYDSLYSVKTHLYEKNGITFQKVRDVIIFSFEICLYFMNVYRNIRTKHLNVYGVTLTLE